MRARQRSVAVLLLACCLAAATGAGAKHGLRTFTASGRVVVPTREYPIVFGVVNACDPDSPIQGVGGYSIQLPVDAPGHPYTLTGPTGGDFDVVWLDGPRGLTCTGISYDGTRGATQNGIVPARADWAFVSLYTGADSGFELSIRLLS